MENRYLTMNATNMIEISEAHAPILEKIKELYRDLFQHDGFGELRVTMRFLKKGQKEIIVICGKEFRFVVDYPSLREPPP